MSERDKTNRDDLELSAYLDGELQPSERRRVERRLASETAYAQRLAQWERTRKMMQDTIEQPGFHARLLHNFYHEERRAQQRRTTWVGAAAAALAMVLAAVFGAVYLGGNTPAPPAGTAPAITGVAPKDEAAKTVAPIKVAAEPAPQPLAETDLPLKLTGTITGDAPIAIIVNDLTGQSGSYGVGDEVVEGVEVTGVERGSVTLDAFGETVTLSQRKVADSGRKAPFEGRWRVHELEEDGWRAAEYVDVRQDGPAVLIASSRHGQAAAASVRVAGRAISLVMDDPQMGTLELAGEFSRDFSECELTLVAPASDEDLPHPTHFLLVRVPEDAAACQQAWDKLKHATDKLAEALRAFSEKHNDTYPETLEELVPDYLDSLAFLGEAGLEAELTPGGVVWELRQPESTPLDNPEPVETLARRFVVYEQQLEALGWRMSLLRPEPLLTVRTDAPALEGRVSQLGLTYFGTPERTNLEQVDAACLGALRASCANNLKQLGLVVKMFANENNNLTPPGWLSVYPEYLTDPGILTSPKDPPCTESYLLLFPAMDLDLLLAENGADMENPAGRAKAQSELPLALNRSDWPGPNPGRNVLFWDGHVEYVPRESERWAEYIATAMLDAGVR